MAGEEFEDWEVVDTLGWAGVVRCVEYNKRKPCDRVLRIEDIILNRRVEVNSTKK